MNVGPVCCFNTLKRVLELAWRENSVWISGEGCVCCCLWVLFMKVFMVSILYDNDFHNLDVLFCHWPTHISVQFSITLDILVFGLLVDLILPLYAIFENWIWLFRIGVVVRILCNFHLVIDINVFFPVCFNFSREK